MKIQLQKKQKLVMEKQIPRKYFIDTHKLNNNILEVLYNKNRHNIINDNNMNQKDYHVITEQEKHLIRTILNMLDKSHSKTSQTISILYPLI